MCGISDCQPPFGAPLGRRGFLAAAAAAPTLALLAPGGAGASLRRAPTSAPAAVEMPPMRRRTEWAGDLAPKSPIEPETVQFLLVHHTADPGSDYQPADVPGMLRQIYNFHTGAEKGWPDIAYNFFVDKFGTIWEGRMGSIEGPVQGSATGGNQGFSQLCCFLGDFEAEPPPQDAVTSMVTLLAWLAHRYDVDVTPGAKIAFTSRGSNLWPAGVEVTTATISTHRQMSQTSCPGTACHELVVGQFQQMVSAKLPKTSSPSTTSSAPPTPTVASTAAPKATGTAPKPAPATISAPGTNDEQAAPRRTLDTPASRGSSKLPIGLGAAAAAAVAGGALALGLHFRSRPEAVMSADSDGIGAVPNPNAPAMRPPTGLGQPVAAVAVAAPARPDRPTGAPTLPSPSALSPVVWWSTAAPPGSAGSASADGLEVFWLATSEYSAGARSHIEASMRASVSKLGSAADVSLGPWFTQMLSTILPSVSHPVGSGLVLGVSTPRECLALSAGSARVEVSDVVGTHKARPNLPGIDRRSGMVHRWVVPERSAWLSGWVGGPGVLSADPGIVADMADQTPEKIPTLLGTTTAYLGVRLSS